MKLTNTDIKLIENNAVIGAQVAVEVARLKREHASGSAYMPALPSRSAPTPPVTTDTKPQPSNPSTTLPPPSALVFGAAAIDITSSTPSRIVPATTTPGTIGISAGGVGRNIAHAAQNLLPAGAVMLVSPVGSSGGEKHADPLGQLLSISLAVAGMRADGLLPRPGRTAACNLVLENGDLVGGVADFSIAEALDTPAVSHKSSYLANGRSRRRSNTGPS